VAHDGRIAPCRKDAVSSTNVVFTLTLQSDLRSKLRTINVLSIVPRKRRNQGKKLRQGRFPFSTPALASCRPGGGWWSGRIPRPFHDIQPAVRSTTEFQDDARDDNKSSIRAASLQHSYYTRSQTMWLQYATTRLLCDCEPVSHFNFQHSQSIGQPHQESHERTCR